jgi:hypothetical protein
VRRNEVEQGGAKRGRKKDKARKEGESNHLRRKGKSGSKVSRNVKIYGDQK